MELDTQTLEFLRRTAQHFSDHQQQAYLVGGSLRNILLGEPCTDWDIVTTGDAPILARRLADTLGGYYVHMHEKANRVVVVVIQHEQEVIFDIAPIMGGTLEADLRLRDFTINALAAPLPEVVRSLEAGAEQVMGIIRSLIDPLHGLGDIKARRIKAVTNTVFRDDPLRLLRAVRLMTRYHLSIDGETEDLLLRDASLLSTVAAERIHEELYAILKPNGATHQLRFLDAHGLLTILIPEFIPARGMRQPSPHYWDVFEHSLETVGALEQLASILHVESQFIAPLTSTMQEDIAELCTLLQEAEQQNIFHLASLTAPRMKLAALLHDIGKPATYSLDEAGAIHFYGHPQAGVPLVQQIMHRLSASTPDRRLVQQVTAHHMRPGQLASQNTPVTPRAIRRYFVDLGPTGIAIALFSLADHLATCGPLPLDDSWEAHFALVRLLLTRYIRERDSILPPRLLSTTELMHHLQLEPGPLVGQLIECLAEAQAEGTVSSKEEALWLAQEKLQELRL